MLYSCPCFHRPNRWRLMCTTSHATSRVDGGRQSLAPFFWGSRAKKSGNPWFGWAAVWVEVRTKIPSVWFFFAALILHLDLSWTVEMNQADLSHTNNLTFYKYDFTVSALYVEATFVCNCPPGVSSVVWLRFGWDFVPSYGLKTDKFTTRDELYK